jgi:hypothetical protein
MSDGTTVEFVALIDQHRVLVRHEGVQVVAAVCATQVAVSPPQCCYDVAAGRLRCPDGSTDGLAVSLVAMAPNPDGSIVAMLAGENLPEAYRHVPICDDQVVECCYDGVTERLVCPGGELDGQAAAIVAAWEVEGQVFVWAVWPGGGGRMPMCAAATECPPVFCCVSLDSSVYVCPGRPELNGTPVAYTEIVVENGFTWAVLEDGTRLPVCGSGSPAPQACPSCPGSPPGQWMSAEHAPAAVVRAEPQGPRRTGCPSCPEGMLLDTRSGLCVPLATMPARELMQPWWKLAGHCCESCAFGEDCTGDCGCDDSGARADNPCGCSKRETNPSKARKRNVTTTYATDPGCPSGQVYCGSSQNENDPPICCDPMAVPIGFIQLSAPEAKRRMLRSRIKTKIFRRNR